MTRAPPRVTALRAVRAAPLVFAIAASNGESLLAHLAAMPEFRADHTTALAHVTLLDATLRGADIRLG